jgi:hypothetical protein
MLDILVTIRYNNVGVSLGFRECVTKAFFALKSRFLSAKNDKFGNVPERILVFFLRRR